MSRHSIRRAIVLTALAFCTISASAQQYICPTGVISEGPDRGKCGSDWVKPGGQAAAGISRTRHLAILVIENWKGVKQCQPVFAALKGGGGFGGLSRVQQEKVKGLQQSTARIAQSTKGDRKSFRDTLDELSGQAEGVRDAANLIEEVGLLPAMRIANGQSPQAHGYLECMAKSGDIDECSNVAGSLAAPSVAAIGKVQEYLNSTAAVACFTAVGNIASAAR